jgi:HSP20 family protein
VEVDDAVRVVLEIPGVPVASVQVRVMGNRIEVTGEKAPDFPAGETTFLCLERIFGKFQRAFEVRGSVNLGEVTARMANGILVITIPKVPERRGRERRIPVTIG